MHYLRVLNHPYPSIPTLFHQLLKLKLPFTCSSFPLYNTTIILLIIPNNEDIYIHAFMQIKIKYNFVKSEG